jgi:hypothetical protein
VTSASLRVSPVTTSHLEQPLSKLLVRLAGKRVAAAPVSRRTARFICGALALFSALVSENSHADWNVVLNGRSVHVNSSRDWNEANWGLGIEREFNPDGRWVRVAAANGFKDSHGEPSYMAGGGIKRRFRVLHDNAYVDLGVIGFLMTREDMNHNRPFPGVLPALTFGTERVALNLTYLPASAVNRVTNVRRRDPSMDGVLFLQLSLDARLFGLRTRSRDVYLSSADAKDQ